MGEPTIFDRMISRLYATCKYYTGYPKDLGPSRVIHFTSEREFVQLLHEGYPVVVAFTIRGNYTKHLDKVLEEAAVEFYPQVKFMRVECPKYPGFCISRQKKEYPFIEMFHSPEQATNQGRVADPNVTKYSVKVLPKDMTGDEKSRVVVDDPQYQYHYGTFQGVANYYPPVPQPPPHPQGSSVVGFPQPVAPPGISGHPYYQRPLGYQAVPVQGYAIIEERPFHESRLPCCGIGMGWFLFIVGFFLGGIPWYLGSFIILFVRVDYREKPGYVACVIASILAIIAITFGITKGVDAW